jgi:hypothetical protein
MGHTRLLMDEYISISHPHGIIKKSIVTIT